MTVLGAPTEDARDAGATALLDWALHAVARRYKGDVAAPISDEVATAIAGAAFTVASAGGTMPLSRADRAAITSAALRRCSARAGPSTSTSSHRSSRRSSSPSWRIRPTAPRPRPGVLAGSRSSTVSSSSASSSSCSTSASALHVHGRVRRRRPPALAEPRPLGRPTTRSAPTWPPSRVSRGFRTTRTRPFMPYHDAAVYPTLDGAALRAPRASSPAGTFGGAAFHDHYASNGYEFPGPQNRPSSRRGRRPTTRSTSFRATRRRRRASCWWPPSPVGC